MAPLEIQEDEMQIPPREKVEGLEVYMTPRVDPKEHKQNIYVQDMQVDVA